MHARPSIVTLPPIDWSRRRFSRARLWPAGGFSPFPKTWPLVITEFIQAPSLRVPPHFVLVVWNPAFGVISRISRVVVLGSSFGAVLTPSAVLLQLNRQSAACVITMKLTSPPAPLMMVLHCEGMFLRYGTWVDIRFYLWTAPVKIQVPCQIPPIVSIWHDSWLYACFSIPTPPSRVGRHFWKPFLKPILANSVRIFFHEDRREPLVWRPWWSRKTQFLWAWWFWLTTKSQSDMDLILRVKN